jgi:hypothetical protein
LGIGTTKPVDVIGTLTSGSPSCPFIHRTGE